MLLLSWGSAIIMTGTEVQPPTMHLAYFEFSKSRWQINRKEPCGSAPSVSLTLCSIRRPTCFFFPLSILRKVCSLPSSNYCNLDDCGTKASEQNKCCGCSLGDANEREPKNMDRGWRSKKNDSISSVQTGDMLD
jgi:hypothetical protein